MCQWRTAAPDVAPARTAAGAVVWRRGRGGPGGGEVPPSSYRGPAPVQIAGGNPHFNKALLAYFVNVHTRVVPIFTEEKGHRQLQARVVLRLLMQSSDARPAVYMERVYYADRVCVWGPGIPAVVERRRCGGVGPRCGCLGVLVFWGVGRWTGDMAVGDVDGGGEGTGGGGRKTTPATTSTTPSTPTTGRR